MKNHFKKTFAMVIIVCIVYCSTPFFFDNANATGSSFSEMLARAEALVNYAWTPAQNIDTWNGNTYNGKTYFPKGVTVYGVPYTLFTSEVSDSRRTQGQCSLNDYKSVASYNYSTTKYCVSTSSNRTGPVWGNCCATFVAEVFGGGFVNSSGHPRTYNVSGVQSLGTTTKNVNAANIVAGDALSSTDNAHIIWVGAVTGSTITIYESTPPVCKKTTLSKPSSGYLKYNNKTYSTVTKNPNITYDSSSNLPSAPTLLNPSISNSFHAYDLYTGISYTPVNATNDIVVRWENTASYYMCAVKALDGEPNPGNSETGTMLVNYQKFTGNTITLYANGIADHLGKWIKVAIDPYNSSGGKGASAYYYFKCYSNNNTTEPPEAPTLNNPSISWYNNGSFKYGISYEDVDIESNLTLRWQNTADKYKIKVISLEGNPNPSASETVSSVMVAQTVVTSTSKTISKSVLQENAGKWVKVYIHAANTAANSDDVYGDAVYYYFKLADAAQQPEEPVSLSVSQSYVETTLTVNGNQAANIPLDLTLSGTNSTPTVTVSNPSIASCSYTSKNGSVLKYSISPLKAGETDITFTVNVNGTKYTAVCHVVVTSETGTDTPTTPSITLSKNRIETPLTVNGEPVSDIPLDVTIIGTDWYPKITVSDYSVASWSGSGSNYYIHPRKVGETDITFSITIDGKDYSAVCHVVVTSEGGTDTPTTPSITLSKNLIETPLTVNGEPVSDIPLDVTIIGTDWYPQITVSDYSVASWSGSRSNYYIHPRKVGETDITFTITVDGKDYSAVCHVVVTSEGGTDTPTTPTKTLEGIGISSYPNKTVYNIGESLDTAGLRITLYYSNGTTETISSGFTTSGFNSATAGTKNVTVTYQGKTASFNVQVIDNGPAVDNYYLILNATSVNIQLTSADRPVQQTLGYQTNIPSTITWTVENNNGAVAISQNSNGTVNIIALKEGSAVLKATANYNNKKYSAECVITVSLNQTPPVADKTIYDIKIASLPNVTEYTYKSTDTPNLTGLTLKVFYSDGTSEIVTDTSKMNVSNFSTKKPVGTKTITVEYEGFETEFNITVKYTWWQWLLVILTFGRY